MTCSRLRLDGPSRSTASSCTGLVHGPRLQKPDLGHALNWIASGHARLRHVVPLQNHVVRASLAILTSLMSMFEMLGF